MTFNVRARCKDVVHLASHIEFYDFVRLLCSGDYIPVKCRVDDVVAIDCMTCLVRAALYG